MGKFSVAGRDAPYPPVGKTLHVYIYIYICLSIIIKHYIIMNFEDLRDSG